MTEISETTSSDWSIPCCEESDYPTPEELNNAFQLLEKGGILELDWKSPGVRPRTPVIEETDDKEVQKEAETKTKDYDFMDEMSSPQIRIRRTTNAAPKGKKKTTNFAGVIDSMMKHGRIKKDPTAQN